MTAVDPRTPRLDEPDTLARICEVLPDLAARLRAADLPLSPDRWQNLLDLLLVLAEQRRLPEDPARLAPLIGSLFCRSEREQQQFQRIFDAWIDATAPTPGGRSRPGGKARAAATAQAEPPPAPRLRWWLLGLALLLAASVGGFYGYNRLFPSAAPESPIAEATPPETPITPPDSGRKPSTEAAPGQPAVAPEPRQTFQPVPPRRLRPDPTLDPVHQSWFQTLGQLCLFLPAFFALAWLLLRWLSWRTVLERRRGGEDDPLVGIALDAGADDLLDAADLREALKRLHAPVALPTRHLDADKTVARTARRAGLFTPARRHRREVPELVVLVEMHHAGDQMAGLAGQLVQRLREAGLGVHRYDYRDSPRRCIGTDGRWQGVAEIAARHVGARLLIVGEPAALLDPHLGEPQRWTRALRPWPRRALLSTRRPPRAWEQALDAAGFAVAEISSAGIRTLALYLGGLRTPAAELVPMAEAPIADRTASPRPASLPRLLQDQGQWTQPVAPGQAQQQALLRGLDGFLGAQGAQLLAAMAVYPQLHWGLTRLLDLSLFPDPDAAGREQRLLRIARLPWSRLGWLPDWLRDALLDRLPPREQSRLRAVYKVLLQDATTQGPGSIALPVSLPEQRGLLAGLIASLRHWFAFKGWRLDRWLHAVKALSPDHGVLNDAIFADILFGWRLPLARFVVPRRLLRRYLGGALGQALAPRLLLALILAFGGAWLADRAWHGWLKHQARPWLMERQGRLHGDYRIAIWHRPEAAGLARALRQTLVADGFKLARIAADGLQLPAGAEPPDAWTNKIQFGDADGAKIALYIKGWLTHLAWGQAPEVADQLSVWAALPAFAQPPGANELRVLLATGGSTGTGFRDALAHELTPEERQALVPPPKLESVEEPIETTPDNQPADSNQDAPKVSDAAIQPSAEPDAMVADPNTEAPVPSAGEPAEAQKLRREIENLEQQLQILRRELELELTGADGRPAGRGPEARRLESEIKELESELRDIQGRLGSATLDQLRSTGDAFRDPLKDGGEGPEMIRLPAGELQMGSPTTEPERYDDEGPQHLVAVPTFAISRTEVSFADYDRFADATGRKRPDDRGWGRGDQPVINIDWHDAVAYADWLSEQTGQAYHLPTEAEWEYAARAGTGTPFWTGVCIQTGQANYNGNYDYNDCGAKTGEYRSRTVPVGSLPANAFGLNEVAGNVYEWVQDCWHGNYSGAPADGTAWLDANGGDCARRVLRGGGWYFEPRYLRSAYRFRSTADGGFNDVGFRLARTLQ